MTTLPTQEVSHTGNIALLIIENRVRKSLESSSSELFLVQHKPDSANSKQSTIYQNKAELLADLKQLIQKANAYKEDDSVEIYGLSFYNIFNHTELQRGSTNLSQLYRLHYSSSVKLNIKGLGYVLEYKDAITHVIEVEDLVEDVLKNGLYPTQGNVENGTLKFTPEVVVYKVESKIN